MGLFLARYRRYACLLMAVYLMACALSFSARTIGPAATSRTAPAVAVATSNVADSELRVRTAELKQRLFSACDAFKAAQEAQWAAQDAAGIGAQSSSGERVKSPLKAEGFGNVEVATEDAALVAARDETIRLIEALADRNPTPRPFEGWRTFDGCGLEGTWKLRFTTGADATFRPSNKTGTPETYQRIDTRKGLFFNCVDFANPEAKLEGFRVVVKGKALSATEVQLIFKRVRLLRRSRLPPLRTLVVPLPPGWLLRGVARWASRGKAQLSERGAGFTMLYLDEELRMHKTFDGVNFSTPRVTLTLTCHSHVRLPTSPGVRLPTSPGVRLPTSPGVRLPTSPGALAHAHTRRCTPASSPYPHPPARLRHVGQYFVQQRAADETYYASSNVAVRNDDPISNAQRRSGAQAATASAYGRSNIGTGGAPEGFVWGKTL